MSVLMSMRPSVQTAFRRPCASLWGRMRFGKNELLPELAKNGIYRATRSCRRNALPGQIAIFSRKFSHR